MRRPDLHRQDRADGLRRPRQQPEQIARDENTLYHSLGRPATNFELVVRAARICADLGHELATPNGAREIIGLPQLGSTERWEAR